MNGTPDLPTSREPEDINDHEYDPTVPDPADYAVRGEGDGAAAMLTAEGAAKLAAQRGMVLWCMHVLGPDDLYAAENYEAAEIMVRDLIAALAARVWQDDILALPIVAVWPWSDEAHAEALAQEVKRETATRQEPRS